MKLLKLRLDNFQGIKSAEFDFEGLNASIYGDNATGKTTIFNAMTWLLFDKASTNSKNFTPKTKGKDGDVHFLEHSAEADFVAENKKLIKLKKSYHENYRKKRGSTEKEFEGHSVDFFVDGVPVKEKEYNEVIQGICGDMEKAKMLTMPDYFPEEMPWDSRRRILLDICGDITDEDVIKSDIELADLNKYLLMPGTRDQLFSVDDYKKIANAKKNDINKQLQEIPNRVDEATRAIPDLTGLTLKAIEQELKKLNKSREELEAEKARVLNGDLDMSALRRQISEATTELAEARSKHTTESSKVNEDAHKSINELKNKQLSAKNRHEDLKSDHRTLEREIIRLNELRQELISEYAKIQTEAWKEDEAVCPTCGRALLEDQVQKLKDEFNQRKSDRLERNQKRGQTECSKDIISGKEANLAKIKEDGLAEAQRMAELDQQVQDLQKQLKTPEPFDNTKEYAEISKKIIELKKTENDKEKQAEGSVRQLREKLDFIAVKISEQEALRSKFTLADFQKNRISDLQDKEKELSKAFEDIEKGIYLCELFVKTKVGLLDEKINGKFKHVRFRLFIEQLNGGITEACDVMVPADGGQLVPYAFANNAGQINAGLEIIDTLSHHYGLSIPVFVDNAEAVTRLSNIDTQMIRLVVSEPDKTLRTEIDATPGIVKEEKKENQELNLTGGKSHGGRKKAVRK